MTYQELATYRNAMLKGATVLTDEEALEVPALFPNWEVGKAYAVGDRVFYEDNLYRCEQAHTAQEEWTPPATKALWTNIALPHEIPVWVQPTGAQDAYNTGDKVWYPEVDTTVYESLIDANVWSPEAYPQGWKAVEDGE